MTIDHFIKGLIIGFSVAAPVGPIGVLCIRKSLAEGRAAGFVTGLGAAAADTAYGLIAGLGLTALSSFLTGHATAMKITGGLFLIFLGIKTFLGKPAENAASAKNNRLYGNFISTFFLTIANPATILSFLAVFAAMNNANTLHESGAASVIAFVTGVFIGSAGWWLLLSSGVSLLRDRITRHMMIRVNRLSGAAIISFALWALADAAL